MWCATVPCPLRAAFSVTCAVLAPLCACLHQQPRHPYAPLPFQAGEAAVEGEEGGRGLLQLTFKLNVQKAAVLLSLLSREDDAAPAGQHRLLPEPTPLLELAAAAITGTEQLLGVGLLLPCWIALRRVVPVWPPAAPG